MKYIILIAILFTGCKKREQTKIVVPSEPKVCNPQKANFIGKFRYSEEKNDTIEIAFLKNKCPNQDSNVYVIKGVQKALALSLDDCCGYTMSDSYTITCNEISLTGKTQDGEVYLEGSFSESGGAVKVKSYKIKNQNGAIFYKIKP